MQPITAVEVEVVVPCTEGQEHPIRLRIVSWEQWEVAYTPCEALLGRAFGLMAPCSHYVRENRDRLKQAVVQQLARVGAPAVPALIQALGDRNEYVRSAAAEALGQIGDASAVPALIQALGDRNEYVRRAAAEALVKIGAPAVPALIQALGDRNEYVRSAAAEALGQIGDVAAVPALRVHAEQLDAAREALQRLGQADYPLEQAVQELAQQELWGVLMRALPAEQVRTAAAQLGTPAVPALIQALKDWDEDVRSAAAWALGQIGDVAAVPALRVHAEQLDAAREALQRLGQADYPLEQAVQELAQQELWGVLMRALPAEQVRTAAAQLGAPAAPALIKALGDRDWKVRQAACEALGQIGDASAVPALIQALGDRNEYVRRAAAEALVKIGAPAVPALIQALGKWDRNVRSAAAEALVKIGAPAVPALKQVLVDERESVREAAANALRRIESLWG